MKKTDSILNFIDDDEVVQLTQEMVAIPSITHREGSGMVNFLERWFKDLDIPVRLYPTSGDRAHIFADYGAVNGPGRFLFNGHQDTKPVDGMTIDPFAAEIREGRMYGRGSCDMKGAIAGFLCAFKALVRAGIEPKGGITFYSDIEEEFSGPDSFMSIIDRGLITGYEGLVSGEPTDLEVHIGNMGAVATAFEVKGKAAHSGLSHLGVNAIHHASLFITEYLKLPYSREENPYFGKPAINFEKIEGGRFFEATVPNRCLICLDSRLIPETPPEEVIEQYTGLINRLKSEYGADIREVEPPKSWRPKKGIAAAVNISPEHPLTLRVADAVERATGKDAVISALPGATFAGVMIRKGLPSIICGPGSIRQAHTEDEWVEVAQLPKAARIYALLMTGM